MRTYPLKHAKTQTIQPQGTQSLTEALVDNSVDLCVPCGSSCSYGCGNGRTRKLWDGPIGVTVVPTNLPMVAVYDPLGTR